MSLDNKLTLCQDYVVTKHVDVFNIAQNNRMYNKCWLYGHSLKDKSSL